MISGRRPKPKLLHELHGTARPCRARNEPEALPGELIPPASLALQKYGMVHWNRYVRTAPPGLLAPVDVALLVRLCIALSRADEADENVIEFGQVIMCGQEKGADGSITKMGTPMVNPSLAISNKQTELARRLAAELALPITGRARLDFKKCSATTSPARRWQASDELSGTHPIKPAIQTALTGIAMDDEGVETPEQKAERLRARKARNQQDCRSRPKGMSVYKIKAIDAKLEALLEWRGLLDPMQERTHGEVEAALERLIDTLQVAIVTGDNANPKSRA